MNRIHYILLLSLLASTIGTERLAFADASPPTVPTTPVDALSAADLRQQICGLWQAKNWDAALEKTNQAIIRFPDDAENYALRAEILSQLERHTEALADARHATGLKPALAMDEVAYWGNLGWQRLLQGDLPAAQELVAKGRMLNPQSFASTLNQGHVYLLKGDRGRARAWYETAIPLIHERDTLNAGPLTDFDLFIARGWQVEASREERAWIETRWEEYYRTALDSKLQQMSFKTLEGDALAWWQCFLKINADKPGILLHLFEELSERNATLREFFNAYKESDANDVIGTLKVMEERRAKEVTPQSALTQ